MSLTLSVQHYSNRLMSKKETSYAGGDRELAICFVRLSSGRGVAAHSWRILRAVNSFNISTVPILNVSKNIFSATIFHLYFDFPTPYTMAMKLAHFIREGVVVALTFPKRKLRTQVPTRMGHQLRVFLKKENSMCVFLDIP